jgi:DnaD/phage-associated family protein
MSTSDFEGFPAIGRATAIPNGFFTGVLPKLTAPGDLLAFLFAAKIVQERRGDVAFVTAEQVWLSDGAATAFQAIAGGRDAVTAGLERCTAIGALLALDLTGPGCEERIYFVNEPGARRSVARARAGDLVLKSGTNVRAVPAEERPGIFRIYEENIGTITPLIGERLLAAIEEYPPGWVADAIREAVELNRRNWRYIERMLERWLMEGRDEVVGRRSFEPGARAHGGSGIPARYR